MVDKTSAGHISEGTRETNYKKKISFLFTGKEKKAITATRLN